MKIDELLNTKSLLSDKDTEVYAVHGVVARDSDSDSFRLYKDPFDKRSFWIIKKSDVVGEIHPWSAEEIVHAGLVGEEMYKIHLPHGCEVRTVRLTIQKLGETIAGDDSPYSSKKKLKPFYCHATSGCSSGCCTEGAFGCECDYCCS